MTITHAKAALINIKLGTRIIVALIQIVILTSNVFLVLFIQLQILIPLMAMVHAPLAYIIEHLLRTFVVKSQIALFLMQNVQLAVVTKL